jgi:hypothetical protein
MSDHRNYILQISFQNQYYLPQKWDMFIDTALINSTRFDTYLTLVRINEHQLGGLYKFQVYDAYMLEGVRKIHGYYEQEGSHQKWSSEKEGVV